MFLIYKGCIMKRKSFLTLMLGLLMSSTSLLADNPFFKEFDTPFGAPPFDKIKIEHYLPAFEKGIKESEEDIAKIINNKKPADFQNTIEALEQRGATLSRVSNVFFNLTSSNTNDQMMEIQKKVTPMITKLSDDIYLNDKLFARVKAVYDNNQKSSKLNSEQKKLLDVYFKEFARNGALLSPSDKDKLREINTKLSNATLKYSDNLLKETNGFKLWIKREAELSGLPESIILSAKEAAKNAGYPDFWLFTLHNPSVMPFLQYSDIREKRKEILDAYLNRGNNDNEFDNKNLIKEIVSLRQDKAKLLGYHNHAEFTLEQTMAKNSEKVFELLNPLWDAALPNARREAEALQEMINRQGENFKLEACDWRYYTEKLRKEKYDLDEETLRSYFKLDNVLNAVFYVTNQLYGVNFKPVKNVPTYHPDVMVYEVTEKNGKHIGLIYLDYYARPSKRGGAWMNNLREQSNIGGKYVSPIVVNCCNFPAPVGEMPSLLTLDEAETLFHEFGHALHGLFANTTYSSIGGTNVPRDFVELPSQIMENWFTRPEVLKYMGKHYLTGEEMPDELIKKIEASSKFNQGFATVEFLAAALLDMYYYTNEDYKNIDVAQFENEVAGRIGLIPEIPYRYRSTYFQHIFSGGYSAGYYSYIWAGVLDSDAFEAFLETSLFDPKTAELFRRNVLEKGGTEDPMELYKKFRGREPRTEPLLKKRGLL